MEILRKLRTAHWLTLAPLVLIAILLALRVVAAFRFQLDLDEPQHLHVVYGWLQGEWPFRDRFDNHAPLFSLLFAPLAAWIGETPHIITLARFAILPFALAMTWVVYRIAELVTDRPTALWTTALLLALADWSLKSAEFRPDVLWALLWFLALWVLISGKHPTIPRAIGAGLLLGVSLCVSIKSAFLAPALFIGAAGVWLFVPNRLPVSCGLALATSATVAFLLPPIILIAAFASAGVTWEMIKYCLFDVNRVPLDPVRVVAAFILGPIALGVAWLICRGRAPRSATAAFLFLTIAAYSIALLGFSPEVRKQTLLVVYPLALILATRLTFPRLRLIQPRLPEFAALAVWIILFGHFLSEAVPWRDGLADHRRLLTATLALTDSDDYLFDGRGESVFADRPVYMIYVESTRDGIEQGRIPDANPNDLAKKTAAIAIGSSAGLTEPMREFLRENYVAILCADLRVAGRVLEPDWEDGRWVERTNVAVPGRYAIIKDGVLSGTVKIPKTGPQIFDFGTDRSPAVLFWQDAWDLGYRPDPATLDLNPAVPNT